MGAHVILAALLLLCDLASCNPPVPSSNVDDPVRQLLELIGVAKYDPPFSEVHSRAVSFLVGLMEKWHSTPLQDLPDSLLDQLPPAHRCYMIESTPVELCKWITRVRAAIGPFRKFQNQVYFWNPKDFDPNPAKLRVGFLVEEVGRSHCLHEALMSFLCCYDRHRLDVFVFKSWYEEGKDILTLMEAVGREATLVHMRKYSPHDMARVIQKHQLHVLCEMTGQTSVGAHRALLPRKLAPVQVHWAGFFAGSGTDAVDYSIWDTLSVPPLMWVHMLTEPPIYLPGSWVPSFLNAVEFFRQHITSMKHALEHSLSAHPAIAFGFMAVGVRKLSPSVFSSLCAIVRRVPGSTLTMIPEEGGANLRKRWVEICGLSSDRLVFWNLIESSAHRDRMRIHLDIVLDSELYGGATTNVDVLSAGVPVVAHMGTELKIAQRMGASVLRAAGLSKLIAYNRCEFEELAVTLGSDRAFLLETKRHVLNALQHSLLFNLTLRTSHLTEGFWSAWQRWVTNQARGEPIYVGSLEDQEALSLHPKMAHPKPVEFTFQHSERRGCSAGTDAHSSLIQENHTLCDEGAASCS